jgi:hypothetical protein
LASALAKIGNGHWQAYDDERDGPEGVLLMVADDRVVPARPGR